MKFKKRPVVVDAFQMTREHRLDNSDWPDWLNQAWNKERGTVGSVFPTMPNTTADKVLSIMTKEGEMFVPIDNWIIRGVEGELYSIDPGIFEKTYEPVELGYK